MRQRLMAFITFNWPRLIWPALAARQAEPWTRKISATSSFGRDNAVYEAPFLPFLRFAAVRPSNGLSTAGVMPPPGRLLRNRLPGSK